MKTPNGFTVQEPASAQLATYFVGAQEHVDMRKAV